MTLDGCAGFRHLHQRDNALLHSGSAGAAEQYNGKPQLGGPFHCSGDPLTYHITHAAHHKPGIAHADYRLHTADGGFSHRHRLVKMRLLPNRRQLFLISRKIQGVFVFDVRLPLLKAILIHHHADSGFRLNPKAAAALGTGVKMLHHILLIEHFAALGAFYPKTCRNRRLRRCVLLLRLLFPRSAVFRHLSGLLFPLFRICRPADGKIGGLFKHIPQFCHVRTPFLNPARPRQPVSRRGCALQYCSRQFLTCPGTAGK